MKARRYTWGNSFCGMIVPMMEAIDIIMRVKMVNLREIKKDHSELVNDFFKIVPFFVGVNDHLSFPGD